MTYLGVTGFEETSKLEPESVRRVLVALQGTRAPIAAISVGRIVARALQVPLHGILTWPTRISPSEIARLLRLDPGTLAGMVLHVEVGDPAEQLSAVTERWPVAFVVLAAESEGCDACGLGVVGARMLRDVTDGVIVVRPGATARPIRRILVPLDGAPSTAAALEPAGELARRAGAALDVVLIEDSAMAPSTEPGAMAFPRYLDQPQHEWPAFSEEFLRRFLGGIGHFPPGVPTRFFLGTGGRAEQILRFADMLDSDLIALVWHGDCTSDRASVFCKVLRETGRPALVLRRVAKMASAPTKTAHVEASGREYAT